MDGVQTREHLEDEGRGRVFARRCLLVLIALSIGTATDARPQETSLLEQVERLADRGELLEARQALERWRTEAEGSSPSEERARGWFLTARLEENGDAAELHYLRVVIEGSSSPYADDALLRLAQLNYARGEYERAVEYLGRLRRDYPTSEHGPEALLWVARSARARGDPDRACSAADQGLQELPPGDAELEAVLREEKSTCRQVATTYTVQVAAFQDEEAAQRLARQLLEQGYDAWVLNATPRDPLYRVRIGRGLIEGEAQALLQRLLREGRSPFLVSQAGTPRDEN